jgi:DNA-binding ferritin-like protein (Dps family)
MTLVVAAVLTLVGCAGAPAQPVRVSRATDGELTCDQIRSESVDLLKAAGVKDAEIESVQGTNVAAFVTGMILLVPMFAMDATGGREIERRAIQKRLERLQHLAAQSDC